MTAVTASAAAPAEPCDLAPVAERLGFKHTCRVEDWRPERVWVDRPAATAKGPLVVTLSRTIGPWTTSPSRPIVVVTHRASGLSLSQVAGPWHATPTGVRAARAALRALLAAPGFDWAKTDPTPPGTTEAAAIEMLRAACANLPQPKARKKSENSS